MSDKLIDNETLLDMLHHGMMQKDIAAHFKVSPAAICKRLKRLLPQPATVLDKHNLTDRQKTFCVAKARGKSATAAAIEAYEVSSIDSAKNIGSQLLKRPEIKEAIDDLMESVGMGRAYRVTRLKDHVDNRDPNVSLKALDMSFKLDGSYAPEKHDVRAATYELKLNRDQYLPIGCEPTQHKEDDPNGTDGE